MILFLNVDPPSKGLKLGEGLEGRSDTWELAPNWQPFVMYNLPKIAR